MLDHVIGVAGLVATLRIDDVSVYASLLHGMVKADDYDSKKMRALFGDEIVDIIETVDRLSCLNFKTKENSKKRSRNCG